MSRAGIFLIAAALALSGCEERVSLSPPPAAAVEASCAARAVAPWRPLRGVELRASAETSGASCATASASLSIADASGKSLYAERLPAAQVMTLAYAEDARAMQVALASWIDQTRSSFRGTSELPVWRPDDEQPVLGEFPFYPEPAFDRAAYAALRDRDAPMFCFVQGMESMACVALVDGALTKVGVQTFPG
ncbi:MAG: hypothetical protein NW206_13695 [Hyphomonadaceae bacterium]|nr:hypothetical protein [Hyphomonadaceae bacterium]